MVKETQGRRQSGRRWALPRRRKGGRAATISPWYPQAQTLVEAGPVVTVPQAADDGPVMPSLIGTLVAWLIVMGGDRRMNVPSAMAMGFGGPDLSPALFGESA